MTSSQVLDQDLDRPRAQAQRCVEPSGTNMACGLAYSLHHVVRPNLDNRSRSLRVVVLFSPRPTSPFHRAGGHGEAVIPVPIPNTEVKRPIAEGSAGPARARVGRRRPFYFHQREKKKGPPAIAARTAAIVPALLLFTSPRPMPAQWSGGGAGTRLASFHARA